jgi:hypothetical protein
VPPGPTGGNEVYRFGCVTVLECASDGLFSSGRSLQPDERQEVFQRWLAAGGKLAAPTDALGL